MIENSPLLKLEENDDVLRWTISTKLDVVTQLTRQTNKRLARTQVAP